MDFLEPSALCIHSFVLASHTLSCTLLCGSFFLPLTRSKLNLTIHDNFYLFIFTMKSSIASLDPTTASIVLRKLASIDSRGSQSPSNNHIQQSSNAICNIATCSSSTNSIQSSTRTSTFQQQHSSSVNPNASNNLHMHPMSSLAHVRSAHSNQPLSSSGGAQSHPQSSTPSQSPSSSQLHHSPQSQSPLNASSASTGHGGIPLMSLHHHHHHSHHPIHNSHLSSASHHSAASLGLISPNSRASYLPSTSPLLTHHLVTSISGNNNHFQAALNNGLANQLIYRPNPLLLRPSTDGATTLTTTSLDNSIAACNTYNQLILMPSSKMTSKSRSNGASRGSTPVITGTLDSASKGGKVVSGQIWRPHIQLSDSSSQPTNLVLSRSVDHNHSNSNSNCSTLNVPDKLTGKTCPESNQHSTNGEQVLTSQVDSNDIHTTSVVTIRSKIDERINKLYEFNKRIHHDSMDETDDEEFELDSDLEEREIFSSLSSDDDITITDLPRIQLTPPPPSQPIQVVTSAVMNSQESSGGSRGRRTRSRSKKQQQQQTQSSTVPCATVVPVRETKNSFLSRLDLVPSVDAVDFKFQKFLKSRVFYERPSSRRTVTTAGASLSCTTTNGTNSKRSNSLSNSNHSGNTSVTSGNNNHSNNKRGQCERRDHVNTNVATSGNSGAEWSGGSSSNHSESSSTSLSSILPPMVPVNDAKVAYFSDVLQLTYLPPSTSFETIQKPRELNWLNIINLTQDIRNNIPRNNISIEQFNLWLDWYKVNEEKFKRELRIKRTKEAMARKEMIKLTHEIKIRFDKLRSLVLNHAPVRLQHIDHLTGSLDKLANCLCSHEKQ